MCRTSGPPKAVLSTQRMALTNLWSGMVGRSRSIISTYQLPFLFVHALREMQLIRFSSCTSSSSRRPSHTSPSLRRCTTTYRPPLHPLIPRHRLLILAHARLLRREQDGHDAAMGCRGGCKANRGRGSDCHWRVSPPMDLPD